MGDASATGPRHDQQHGDDGQRLRAVDEAPRCLGEATGKDAVMVVPVGSALAAERQSEPPLDSARLSDMLSALARKHQVPGAQLAIRHGGETVAVEVGELQYGTGCPVTRDAAFPIGSISKTFTATVAMILVADGDLELEAPLGEHVPELGDLGNELTLRQVLSHTGGFAADPGEEVLSASVRRYVLDHCRSQNLVLPPGTGFSYSNIGYVLVGHLIETVTGMSWWDAMESILLRPLKIEPTFVAAPGRRPLVRPLATGHSVNTAVGKTRPLTQSLALAAAPAGGLAVSAVDLVTLGTQLDGRTPGLLPSVYAEQMRQAVPGAELFAWADGWGLGLAVFGNGNSAWLGHFGSLDGAVSDIRLDPVTGCVVAFTSNATTGLHMWKELVDELRRVGVPVTDGSTNEAQGRLAIPPPGCVGSYLNGNVELTVAVTDTGVLSVASDGDDPTELIFFKDLSFAALEQPSMRIGRLLRDPVTGNLEGIQLGLYVARRPSKGEQGRCSVAAQTLSA